MHFFEMKNRIGFLSIHYPLQSKFITGLFITYDARSYNWQLQIIIATIAVA